MSEREPDLRIFHKEKNDDEHKGQKLRYYGGERRPRHVHIKCINKERIEPYVGKRSDDGCTHAHARISLRDDELIESHRRDGKHRARRIDQ